MRCAVVATIITLAVGSVGCRTQAVVPPMPVPPPPIAAVAAVREAKKVFVLNGGEMVGFAGTYPYGLQVCYNEFYTALARTQQFQLVQDPADADLVVMIEGIQITDAEPDLRIHSKLLYDYTDLPAKIVVSLIPRGANEPVYTMSVVPAAAKKDPENKLALAEAISGLTNRLNAMTGAAAAQVSAADLIQANAPVPNKVLAGKRVFVMADTKPPLDFYSGADWLVPFSDDLRASNRYTVLSSIQDADLVLQLSFNRRLRIRILDGLTMKQLWTVDDPKWNYSGIGKKLTRNDAAGAASAFSALTNTSQTP